MIENKLQPELRFPEFNAPLYKSDFGKLVTNKAQKYNPITRQNYLECIDLENLSQETGNLTGKINCIEKKSIKNIFNKGDVLFGKLRPYLRKFWYAKFQGICSTEIWVLQSRNINEIINKYIYHIIQRDYFIDECNKTIGSKMPRADWKQVFKISVLYPTTKEQTKIANFLTSVDEKIDNISKELSLFKDYKKGMMQRIFSQEIRFKDRDGWEFPEWVEKKLGDLLKTVSTQLYQIPKSKILEQGLYKVVDQGQRKISGYSNEIAKVLKNQKMIVYGDHTTTVKYVDFDFIVGADGTKCLNFNEQPKTQNFLKYVFYNIEYKNIPAEGYKRHFSILKNIYLSLPNLKEQTKIANFLSSIDEKIDNLTASLKYWKLFKKSLLQKMFV